MADMPDYIQGINTEEKLPESPPPELPLLASAKKTAKKKSGAKIITPDAAVLKKDAKKMGRHDNKEKTPEKEVKSFMCVLYWFLYI